MRIDFRERRREEKRERERHINWLPLAYAPTGPNLPPRHVPSLGIEPVTFRFTEQCSNQLSHTSQGSA